MHLKFRSEQKCLPLFSASYGLEEVRFRQSVVTIQHSYREACGLPPTGLCWRIELVLRWFWVGFVRPPGEFLLRSNAKNCCKCRPVGPQF